MHARHVIGHLLVHEVHLGYDANHAQPLAYELPVQVLQNLHAAEQVNEAALLKQAAAWMVGICTLCRHLCSSHASQTQDHNSNILYHLDIDLGT